jgi:phage replication O-like protein O
MANPQKENGYTPIANEILEQIIKTNLNGTQFRLVMAIWRYTYGFRRKQHDMSISHLASLIDASRSQVNRELDSLISKKILKVNGIGKRGTRILSFNKNYSEWIISKKEVKPVKKSKPVEKPKAKKKYDEDSTYYKMALYFYEKVSAVAKEAGIEHLIKKSNLQTWADDMRKLIEIDKIDKRLAKEVMDWVVTDDFWKTNVLSARKLREKFAELAIKMTAKKQPKQKQQDTRDREIALQRWIAEGNDPNEFKW